MDAFGPARNLVHHIRIRRDIGDFLVGQRSQPHLIVVRHDRTAFKALGDVVGTGLIAAGIAGTDAVQFGTAVQTMV